MKFLWILIYVQLVVGAKDYLFKTCEQNGFCKRNIEYSAYQETSGSNPYTIKNSLNVDKYDAIVKGTLTKVISDHKTVDLPFVVSILKDTSIRVTIDEKRTVPSTVLVNPQRYNPSEILDIEYEHSQNVKVTDQNDGITIEAGGMKYVVHKQFQIDVFVNQTLQMTINKDHLLNFEHFRLKEDNKDNLLPGESDFNMFEDNFADSKHDKIPLGPESVALDFDFFKFKNAYGIPEHAGPLNLQNDIYRMFNVDIFEYDVDSNLPMYGSIPFLMAAKPDLTIGLFWVNSADTYVKVHKQQDLRTHWMSESGVLDFILFFGNTPEQVNQKYGAITGYTGLPQLFSLGYHQCRWNYNDDRDLIQVTNKFDEYMIPFDTIWLDIEYTDSKKYFTWNNNFPNPHKLLNDLDGTGRNLVVIIDPHIKTGYKVSNYLIDNRMTIMDSNNQTFKGHCWPGESVWVDSFNPRCQAYWDTLHDLQPHGFLSNNTNIHLWNDMNEISVFDGPETSGPKDLLHYGDIEDRAVHNLNGRKFHDITYESLTKRLEKSGDKRTRPFILTRSYFSGSQKTAAMWTGDNMSKWEYLKVSIPMVLNNGVAGMPFAGADVGGFFGNPSKDLLTRWYQTGMWYPFFRAHAHIDSRRREPWVPGEPFTSIIRDAINLRYNLLPEFYNAFWDSSVTGTPILRPMFYVSSTKDNFDVEDQFMLGKSGIIVKPVTSENCKKVDIVFPDNGVYYDYKNGVPSNIKYTSKLTVPVTLNDIPMVLKGGSIISRKNRYRRSSKLMVNDPYTLTIAPDTKGASGSLYVDDYESFDHLNGDFLLTTFEYRNGQISNTVEHASQLSVPNKVEQIILLDTTAVSITLDSSPLNFENSNGNVIIKNPGVKVNTNWTINVQTQEPAPQHDEL